MMYRKQDTEKKNFWKVKKGWWYVQQEKKNEKKKRKKKKKERVLDFILLRTTQ